MDMEDNVLVAGPIALSIRGRRLVSVCVMVVKTDQHRIVVGFRRRRRMGRIAGLMVVRQRMCVGWSCRSSTSPGNKGDQKGRHKLTKRNHAEQ